MKRSAFCLFALVFAVVLAGLAWPQTSPVTLSIQNPVTPGTNVAMVTQGDPAQVQYTTARDFIPSITDRIELRRIDTDAIVSEMPSPGTSSATVFLSTTPNNAVGDLKALYVDAHGNILATAPQILRVSGTGQVRIGADRCRTWGC
jgi:hypothetical protein